MDFSGNKSLSMYLENCKSVGFSFSKYFSIIYLHGKFSQSEQNRSGALDVNLSLGNLKRPLFVLGWVIGVRPLRISCFHIFQYVFKKKIGMSVFRWS